MNKIKLQKFIEMLVENVLLQEKEPAEEAGIDLGNDKSSETTDTDTTETTDIENSIDTLDTDSESTGAPATDAGTEGAEEDGLSTTGGMGGGGFGGGFSGGGSLGGGPSDSSDSETDGEDTKTGEEDNPEEVEVDAPADPIQSTIDLAIKMTKEVGDNQIILNVVKSNIQKYFNDFDDSIPVIQGLWNTNDPNLKIVARKLIMFIKGD